MIKKIIREEILKEVAGISIPVRNWAKVIYGLLSEIPRTERRLIVDGKKYPELFKDFSFDYAVIDFNDWTNGYLTETSGYDSNGYYVVHIMVLNRFRNHPYMLTILNHELKHAYQDWKRQSKGYPTIDKTRENIQMYTGDFIKVLKDKIAINPVFKKTLKGYYLLSDLELDAFLENVYDKDELSPYKKMVSEMQKYDPVEDSEYSNSEVLEEDWQKLLNLNIPFLKKYKNYLDFLTASTKYFKVRSEEILRKVNKMEYIHRDRDLLEGTLKEQVVCHMVSPRGRGKGGYIGNEEAMNLIGQIENDHESLKKLNSKELKMFYNTIKDFKQDILKSDTNLDNIDTYLHKLTNIFKCHPI